MRLTGIRRLVSFVAVTCVATAAGLPAWASSTQAVAADPPSTERRQAIEGLAFRVQSRAEKSAAYSGVRVADNGNTVEVFTTNVSTDFRRSVIGADSAANIVFHTITHTASQLENVESRIRQDEPLLRAHGVRLVSAFPAPEIDGVQVKVERLTPSVRNVLESRYGEVVSIVEGAPVTSADSRLNDSPPWNGGDVIAMDNGSDCSSGPGVVSSSGRTYVLTAGHCFLGQATNSGMTGYTYRTFQASHIASGDDNALMGLAAAERTVNGYDVALIDARSFGRDWRTAQLADASTATRQAAAKSSQGGIKVCASGAFSGENCNANIIHAGGTVWVDGVPFAHMTEAVNPGIVLAGPGDSGSPVYEVHSSGLFIFGILIAVAPNMACQYYNVGGRANRCSDDIFYQEMVSIGVHLGVSLYTP
jgi:hypothetical protein